MKANPGPDQLIFLPGASGNTEFWKPVSNLLSHKGRRIYLGWPGFGQTPPAPDVNGINDLVKMVMGKINRPSAIIAQSMGGVIAIRAALEKPGFITHLVLTVTSGGVSLDGIEIEDWRHEFRKANPLYPPWFEKYQEDLSLQLREIKVPTLLLWGDNDPISPVEIGQRLASCMTHAQLHVIPGGAHDLAFTHAAVIAPLIGNHLST